MKKILVLEDNAFLQKLIVKMFSRRGHQCLPAESAEAAEKILARERVDCIISDLNLPGKSGVLFVRETLLRQPDLPVIVVTGAFKENVPEAEMLSLGIRKVFAKPFDYVALIEAVEQALLGQGKPAGG